MAYLFIVETGQIEKDATSYCTVEFATDYITQNIHVGPEWVALDLLTQQWLLSWASRYLDQRATWYGIPAVNRFDDPDYSPVVNTWSTPPLYHPPVLPPNTWPLPPDEEIHLPRRQPMRWPRHGTKDVDGQPIPIDVIPKQLKDATAEMARYLIDNDRSLERPQDFLTELKADTLTLKFRDATLSIVPPEVAYILRGLGTISSGKTNFSKITRA